MDWMVMSLIVILIVMLIWIVSGSQKLHAKFTPLSEQLIEDKGLYEKRLANARDEVEQIRRHITEMTEDYEEVEKRRQELQDQVNEIQMIAVPAGSFHMGSPEGEGAKNESPAHVVHLDAYMIDKYEVTNLQYKMFIDATHRREPYHWKGGTYPLGLANHPVVNVSWEDAAAYAEWVRKRLPTEAEWEKAARGTDRRPYPWGFVFHESYVNAKVSNESGTTCPADTYPMGASPYGIIDMVGNVSEWVGDYYEERYYIHSSTRNPAGPERGKHRVIRGGAFNESSRRGVRCSARFFADPDAPRENIGFRCVKSKTSSAARPSAKEKAGNA